MTVIDRIKRRRRQQEPSPLPGQSSVQPVQENQVLDDGGVNSPSDVPVQAPVDTPATEPSTIPSDFNRRDLPVDVPKMDIMQQAAPIETLPKLPTDERPEWAKLSYEELVKKNPNWSRGQYAYELAKWRRENGQPDMSYTEWTNILKGQDPNETEKERQQRERRNRNMLIAQGVGSVLGNLINYARAKNGHVAMRLDDGAQDYNRLQRMRDAQRQTARINANAWLDAMGRDRAERVKAEAQAAAAQSAQRDYEMRAAELKIKIDNAKNQEARREAEAALKKLEFEWKQKMDDQRFKETKRHNQQMEANGRNGRASQKYIELVTSDGNKRYTPDQDGSNWIYKAYQEMLKQPGGKKYGVQKVGGLIGTSAPTENEMYDAITRYNSDQWKNRYKTNRYSGGIDYPPLE